MRINITARLFIVILLVSAVATVTLVGLLRWNVEQTMIRHARKAAHVSYTSMHEQLEEFYDRYVARTEDEQTRQKLNAQRSQHSDQSQTASSSKRRKLRRYRDPWEMLKNRQELWAGMLFHTIRQNQFISQLLENPSVTETGGESDMDVAPPFAFDLLIKHFVLMDKDRVPIIGAGDVATADKILPLYHRERVVGYLGFLPIEGLLDEHQGRFLRDLQETLVGVSLIMLIVSAGFALLLARKMVKPIKQLAAGTHRLAAGELDTRIEVATQDEIGTLTDDFNHLAFTLEKNEQARRQWMAEISHELRTPVAVLRGEIEALQDGIRPTNADALASLHAEAVHLGRLADDLHQLALSDIGTLTYQREDLDLVSLLKEVCSGFEELYREAQISLRLEAGALKALFLFADDNRLRQLFDNLFENALKYTDHGGHVVVSVTHKGQRAVIDIQDSAPGVKRDELERLLDRFYRSPKDRNSSGGAGLGLHICRNIVEGHQGRIKAMDSPLGGLWVQIELPIRESLS